MNCLNYMNYRKLNDIVKNKLKIENWGIYGQTVKDRLKQIKDKNYYKSLQLLAKQRKIPAHEAEILSWLDTLNIMYYALEFIDEKILEDITIIQEYKIPFSNKRADYLLVYQNKILILEFSFDRLGDKYKYETKLGQAIGYKELLTSILPSNIEVGTYTYIIEPEVDDSGNILEKYNKYTDREELANNEKTETLGKYISWFFQKDKKIALERLNYIDSIEEDSICKNKLAF